MNTNNLLMFQNFSRTVLLLNLFCFALSAATSIQAQTSKVLKRTTYPIAAEDRTLFLAKPLYVILPKYEEALADEYTKRLSKIWTTSPIQAVSARLYDSLGQTDKNAFLEITRDHYYHNGGANSVSYAVTHYYISACMRYMKTTKGVTAPAYKVLMGMYMGTDSKTLLQPVTAKDNVASKFYQDAKYPNYSLPMVASYLRIMKRQMDEGQTLSVFKEFVDKERLALLKQDTLFISENAIAPEDRDELKGYKGTYQIVSNRELIDIYDRRMGKPFFLLDYVQTGSDKVIGILDVQNATYAFREYHPISYRLKSKDFKHMLP